MDLGRSESPKITGNGLLELTANAKIDESFRASLLLRRIEALEKLAGIRK